MLNAAPPGPRAEYLLATVSGRAVIGALAFFAVQAFGQAKEKPEHVAVFEVGGAADWGLTGGPVGLGGTFAVEVTPIERWLEIEAGVSALGANGRNELATDFLLKKPFQVFAPVDFMAGAGPELSWDLSGRQHGASLTTEFVLDFMIWPTANVGWYVEPSYNISGFGAGSQRAIGVEAGLIIGVPW
jgi:hypothetical protein